jgi:hypothetical protein
MTALLRSETQSAVSAFLRGETSPKEFEVWIISRIDELPADEQAPLWHLRLLLIEYGEDLRPIDEAREYAEQLLADSAA